MTKTEKKRQLLMEQIQELMKETQGILRTAQLYEFRLPEDSALGGVGAVGPGKERILQPGREAGGEDRA